MRKAILTLIFSLPLHLLAQLPLELEGLELWVRADSSMELNIDRVITWYDLSENARDLSQNINNFRPVVLEDQLAGHRTVYFNGINNRLVFDEVPNARSIFWVLKEDDDATGARPLLGHSSTFPFFRGENQEVWHPDFADEAVRDGVTRVGFEAIDGDVDPLPDGYQIVSLRTTGDVVTDQLGQDRNTNNFWKGEIAELLVFSTELTPEQVETVENFLADHYSVSLNLGDDIAIAEGFCHTTLSATPGFLSYDWNTGDTGPTIDVNNSGIYVCEALDAFGRIQVDSIEVTYPGNTIQQEQGLICIGDSLQWNLELDEELYTIEWNDGEPGAHRWFLEEGEFFATITDENLCVLETPELMVQVDSFPLEATLGPDVELCSGNFISLDPAGAEITSYLWMESVEDEQLEILETGEYFVEAENTNGCQVFDTIMVEIVGQSPEVVILQPPFTCQNVENTFQASASADGFITSYEWNFANAETGSGQIVEWTPDFFGFAEVSVLVTVETGCTAEVSVELNVNAQPEATIGVGQACANSEILFSTNPTVEEGLISSIDWVFEGASAEGDIVSFETQEAGFSNVLLTVDATNGCSLSLEQIINVFPSPEITIINEPVCFGELSAFELDIQGGAGNIVSYDWLFGDGATSSQDSPQHFYTQPGGYVVSAEVIAENGCRGDNALTTQVLSLPEADFPVGNACIGEPYLIVDASVSFDDIDTWEWEIDELGSFEGVSISPTFESLGFQEVTLFVTTVQGCSDEITKQIPVFELPVADFSFDPVIGLPPLEVDFINESEGATEFVWNFGTGDISEEAEPTFVYNEEGSFEINLSATNVYGCRANANAVIDVTEPILDLRMEALNHVTTDFGYQVSALIVNSGNYRLDSVACVLTPGNGNTLVEWLNEPLDVGESRIFTWQSTVQLSASSYPYYCAETIAYSELASERTPEDNSQCGGFTVEFELTPLFPNPARADELLTMRIIGATYMEVQFRVIDLAGREVIRSQTIAINPGFNQYQLDLTGLSEGQYLFFIEGVQGEHVQTLMIWD
ncbi:MAG: PKD domain-containing protein [Flavobacteriales bacterium]|nr:PKD domain-containing protein [Flavobacteriales bacterium]